MQMTPSTLVDDQTESSRLIIVHHTLPWSFTPATIEARQGDAAIPNQRLNRIRSRPSLTSRTNGSAGSLHCIRPSICNFVAELQALENRPDPSIWQIHERMNHPALFAGEAEGIGERVFVGWPGHCLDAEGREIDIPDEPTRESIRKAFAAYSGYPVFIDNKIAQDAFSGYYRNTLWPLLHYAIKDLPLLDALKQRALWDAFVAANKLYLDTVLSVYRPGDIGKKTLPNYTLYFYAFCSASIGCTTGAASIATEGCLA